MAHILIVEDNEDIALLYSRMFSRHTSEVVTSAPAAIDYLKTHKPDLMILDFHLSGSMGMTVLEEVRSHPEQDAMSIVAISADDMYKEEAKKKGAVAFMTKPIDIDQVMTTVEQLLKPKAPVTVIQAQPNGQQALPHSSQPATHTGQG